MHQEGSRNAGDEYVTDIVAACWMTSEGEDAIFQFCQELKGGKYLKYGNTGMFYK